MKPWRAILAACALFLCGAVTGALVHKASSDAAQSARRESALRDWIDAKFGAPQKIQRELDLTAAQTQRIEAILDQGRARIRDVWKSCQPQMREEMKRVREQIEAELSVDQKTRFDEMLKRSRSRGPRPPAPGAHAEKPGTPAKPAVPAGP